jgi:hypothetical protein
MNFNGKLGFPSSPPRILRKCINHAGFRGTARPEKANGVTFWCYNLEKHAASCLLIGDAVMPYLAIHHGTCWFQIRVPRKLVGRYGQLIHLSLQTHERAFAQ